jgi:hypothetical protein
LSMTQGNGATRIEESQPRVAFLIDLSVLRVASDLPSRKRGHAVHGFKHLRKVFLCGAKSGSGNDLKVARSAWDAIRIVAECHPQSLVAWQLPANAINSVGKHAGEHPRGIARYKVGVFSGRVHDGRASDRIEYARGDFDVGHLFGVLGFQQCGKPRECTAWIERSVSHGCASPVLRVDACAAPERTGQGAAGLWPWT